MNRDCPKCGMQVDTRESSTCPKCDHNLLAEVRLELLEVDVCHDGEDRHQAEQKILDGINAALRGGFAGLRVIHGYGSRGRRHTPIRETSISVLKAQARRHGYRFKPDGENRGASVLLFG